MSDDAALKEEYRRATAALERALHLPPLQVSREADIAERAIVRARDQLILRLHQNAEQADTSQWRETLNQVNAALSLIISLEYPIGGVPRESIEHTLRLIQTLPQS